MNCTTKEDFDKLPECERREFTTFFRVTYTEEPFYWCAKNPVSADFFMDKLTAIGANVQEGWN